MRIIYGANASPFVRKVRVFLAEKNLPYQLEPVMPFKAGAEFRQISPLGRIPAYRDEQGALADSSVICAYLERTHPEPALYPSDPYDYARALWFEEYGDGGLNPVLTVTIFRQKIMMPAVFRQPTDEAAVQKALTQDMPPMFDYLESQLDNGGTALVGGQFSIADIGVATHFVNLQHAGVGVDAQRWPKLASYIASVHARPSFQAVIAEEEATFKAKAKGS